eukprot:1194231-Prorocentrum_minimum.AAC.1
MAVLSPTSRRTPLTRQHAKTCHNMPQHATTCHNMPQPANMPPEMPPEKAQVQIDIIRGRGRGETPRITTFQFFMLSLTCVPASILGALRSFVCATWRRKKCAEGAWLRSCRSTNGKGHCRKVTPSMRQWQSESESEAPGTPPYLETVSQSVIRSVRGQARLGQASCANVARAAVVHVLVCHVAQLQVLRLAVDLRAQSVVKPPAQPWRDERVKGKAHFGEWQRLEGRGPMAERSREEYSSEGPLQERSCKEYSSEEERRQREARRRHPPVGHHPRVV